jgi:hypothetical protein
MALIASRDVFVLQDLFAVGLGFDIAGALLLALGLLVSPRDVMRRSAIVTGFNSSLMVSQARNRADGEIGLVALVAGFVLQGVAYALTLGGLGGLGEDGGGRRGVVAAALSLIAVVIVLLAWMLLRQPLVNRTLVAVAHLNYETKPMERSAKPYAGVLASIGRELGHEQRPDEDVYAYVSRVFDVEANPDSINPQPPPREQR